MWSVDAKLVPVVNVANPTEEIIFRPKVDRTQGEVIHDGFAHVEDGEVYIAETRMK